MLGKILGGFLGTLIAGPIGFFIGVAIGHLFDKGVQLNLYMQTPNVAFAQKVFFSTTFEMMGYIAKADGRVSEREIQAARNVMSRLQLDKQQKLSAINYFNLGKSPQFNWESAMDNFIKNCGQDPHLVQFFLEIQIQAAYVEGTRNPYKRHILENLFQKLQMPQWLLTQMEARYYAEEFFTQHQQRQQQYRNSGYQQQSQRSHYTQEDELSNAYKLLGVSASATNQEIKKAYRQMMSQHHPDKLVAKGLPEEMIKVATEKTQKIQKAYEVICRARGMK